MSENKTTGNSSSDEIDLGQLFRMIGKGFDKLFNAFLLLFLYLRTNFIKLAILIFVGFAIGFALKFLISDQLKTDIIVRPNFDSKDYLYNVVEEIEANLKIKDTVFFGELGIVISELKSLKIQIESIQEETNEINLEDDIKYLETLQNFKENSFVLDVVKAEIQKKSNMNHRITFFYKNPLQGRVATLKLMDYIQNNKYFNEVKDVYNENARLKIKQNNELINQIDELISGYSKNLVESDRSNQATLLLETENGLDITGLLNLKNALVKDTELKKLELVEQKEVVHIINFGKNQKVRTPIYAQGVTVIPMILLILFFIYSIIKYLNKKANEIK